MSPEQMACALGIARRMMSEIEPGEYSIVPRGPYEYALAQAITTLQKEKAALASPCEWYEDNSGDYWVPGCDVDNSNLWTFGDGGPVENKMRFCGYCGHPVKVVPTPNQWGDDDDEDDDGTVTP